MDEKGKEKSSGPHQATSISLKGKRDQRWGCRDAHAWCEVSLATLVIAHIMLKKTLLVTRQSLAIITSSK